MAQFYMATFPGNLPTEVRPRVFVPPFLPTRAVIIMSLAQLSSPRLRARDEQVPEPALKGTV